MDHALRVRECASALKDAIAEARAAGYRVDGVGNLDGIGVSETAKTIVADVVGSTERIKFRGKREASAPTPPKE